MADTVSKSWFAVFNNPQDHGYDGEPQDVLKRLVQRWIEGHPTRSCAMTYCESAEGLRHVHMVLEDEKAMRFSMIQKVFLGVHLESTKGSKEQAEDYINKRGKWQEKGESILAKDGFGVIKGCQGKSRDLDVIEELINQGKTPSEIMSVSLRYRLYEKEIKSAYFAKRKAETPFVRDVKVIWHVGASGSGKSYSCSKVMESFGEDNVYFVSQYGNGFMDDYGGQKVLFMDEFRGGIRYSELLAMLDNYKTQIHARYSDVYALWTEVHITSVFPPDALYSKMVEEHKDIDTFQQLKRRINTIVYHWRGKDNFFSYEMDMESYTDYDDLKRIALSSGAYVPRPVQMGFHDFDAFGLK